MDQTERLRKWYLENRALTIFRASQWHKNNPEKSKAAKARYRQKNRAKAKIYNDARYANSDEVKAATRLNSYRWKYGLTPEMYAVMNAAQNGLCAVCSRPQVGRGFTVLCVDHDHDTKSVRKLLCHGCNLGLGNFEDNPSRLEAAAAYLRAHGKH